MSTYSLVHLPAPYDGATVDLTAQVNGIQLATDTGLDEINSLKVELRDPGTISHYDRFRLFMRDDSGNEFVRWYEYAPGDQSMTVSESAGFGRVVVLTLLGLEYHLDKIHYVANHIGRTGAYVASDIVAAYNESRGSDQPELTVNSNALPTWINNNFPYGETPVPCRDRLNDLAKSFAAPPSIGGTLDFYTMEYDSTGPQDLELTVRSLGARDAGTITAGALAGGEDDRMTSFAPPQATRIVGVFGRDSGSLPPGYAEYAGRELRYQYLPPWDATAAYPAGAEVRADRANFGPVHVCIAANTGVPVTNAAFWRRETYAEYLGHIQYSPWTDDKATLWASCGFDPGDDTDWGKSMPDFNAVVRTDDFFRTTVDHAGSAADIPSELGAPYRGFKLLNLAAGTIQMHDGESFATLYDAAHLTEGAVVIDENTGDAWVRGASGFARDHSASGRDCMHPYDSIQNVQGVIPNTAGMATNQNSAIEITYEVPAGAIGYLDRIDQIGRDIANAVDDYIEAVFPVTEGGSTEYVKKRFEINRDFYKAGCSLRLKFPFPSSTYGGITEPVGGLYGGGTGNEPATVDIANSTLAGDGARGFNHARAADLGRISAVAFFIRVNQTVIGSGAQITEANMQMRCALRDLRDNVMVQDFTISFNNKWEGVQLPVSGFKPYNALAPKQYPLDYIIAPQAIEQIDSFEWWNVKDITITLLTGYDGEGRYDIYGAPSEFVTEGLSNVFSRPAEDFVSALAGRRIRIAVDAVRFAKELVVVSDPSNTNNQEKIIREPEVGDHATALYYLRSEEERARHPKTDVVFDIEGNLDLHYGDSITFSNPAVGTHKLAIVRLEHSFLRDGFRTRVFGSVRFQ